ncbi:urease-associated protein [Methylobacterium fujisawaense]|uniref:lysozyme inhibitor LprI family protein n=1 Tax=Methylobacterium fujisawaense TaxID=107400 RepID=UPI002F30527E
MRNICLGVLMLWPTAVIAKVPALCAAAPNQAEGTLCAKRRLDAAEAGLAKARDALHAKLDPVGRRNLDLVQEAWRRFRDLECRLETGFDAEHPERNGTIMPMLVGECATALTERRTRDLTDQLACPGGDMSCGR